MGTTIALPERGGLGHKTLIQYVRVGLVAGLTGTLVMDLVQITVLPVMGLPPGFTFSIVGDTVARLLFTIGLEVSGGVLVGLATPYLVGAIIGIMYGIIVSQVNLFHPASTIRGIFQAVLFVEVLCQPMVAMTPIFLKMSLADTLAWVGGAFILHIIWGMVLGGFFHVMLRRK